ncbi:hypothetical protein [Actinomadura alba]|uniref:HAD family hydrolase n=1 Tax=Actinomadura alba TaxID=406431 RepID=UPI0031E0E446
MFVGDTVWDVQACTKAGVPCVGVLTGGSPGTNSPRRERSPTITASGTCCACRFDDSPITAH